MQVNRNEMMSFPPPISRDRIIREFPQVCFVLFYSDAGKSLSYCEISAVKMVKTRGLEDVDFIGNV